MRSHYTTKKDGDGHTSREASRGERAISEGLPCPTPPPPRLLVRACTARLLRGEACVQYKSSERRAAVPDAAAAAAARHGTADLTSRCDERCACNKRRAAVPDAAAAAAARQSTDAKCKQMWQK